MPTPIVLPSSPVRTDAVEVTFVGTATTLVSLGGFTVLTDPNFLHQGQHAKLGYGLRSRRLTEPAMGPEDLPPVDLVVLSHHHGDHFDEVAAAALDKQLPIVTTPHAARKLARQGFTAAHPLRTWETQVVRRGSDRMSVTALPGKHARQPLRSLLPPVMGSMLESALPDGRVVSLYITGDTLVHDGLAEIRRRYPSIQLALLHLGGTRVFGVLLTMDAAQGVEALQTVRPERAIPIHFDDYTVFKSPLSDFLREVEGAGLDTEVITLERGETYRLPSSQEP